MEEGDSSDMGLNRCSVVPLGGSGVKDVAVPNLTLHFGR